MAETWYRGQSTTVEPSSPGGSIHDFGDGVYLTNSKAVAELYAQTRVAHGGGQPEVLTITLGRNELGRVLDLNVDPRWQQFLRTPQIPNKPDTAPENLIRMANENYGRFFEQFTRQNNIRLQNYEAVIGPEFVRGGTQLCILNRNGQVSPLGLQIRARLQPVQSSPGPQDQSIPIVPVRNLVQQSRVQGIVGNQAAMALLGQLLGTAIQSIGDFGIQWRVQREVETTYAQTIQHMLARGDGVLVIIALQEWIQPDFNGMRGRGLLSVYVQGGPTQAAALENWRGVPRLLQGPAKGWRVFERYAWIDPSR